VELKESSVVRIILGEDNLEEWRKKQIEDSTISMFLRGKELGERPCGKRLNKTFLQRFIGFIGMHWF